MIEGDWTPVPVTKRSHEKDIEGRAKERARRKGWYVRKFTSPSQRSVPDDIFIKNGAVVFGEFKRPGKKPTMPQAEEHRKLRAAGVEVLVLDDADDAIQQLSRREPMPLEDFSIMGIKVAPNILCPICYEIAPVIVQHGRSVACARCLSGLRALILDFIYQKHDL